MMSEFQKYQKIANLPANITPNISTTPNLIARAIEQFNTCPHCKGGKKYCEKIIVTIEDNIANFESQICEMNERVNAETNVKELLKSSGIPKIYHHIRAKKDFKITDGNRNAAKLATAAITNNQGLYFFGKCGAGKTMLASIIANERAILNKPSVFITTPDIFNELNPYLNEDQFQIPKKRRLIRECPCLIIDDLGAEKVTDWTCQTLFDILNYRYNNTLQTIITSNFNLDRLKYRMESYSGDRVIRRIKAICEPVYMEF